MKRLLLPVVLLFFCFTSFSQVPDAFNYQAVVRNSAGEIVANQDVSIRIGILLGSPEGEAVYYEVHHLQTNQFGLANLQIGKGEYQGGDFSPGGWGIADHYIKIEIDPEGGDKYIHAGTSQLLSVPYAFHAQTVEDDLVNDADPDPTNELQAISLNGSLLSLSRDGGAVNLPSGSGLWTGSGSNVYRPSGNVGIGTTNPLSRLSVGGNGASNAVIYSNATDGLYYGGHFFTDHFSGKAVSGEASNEQGTGVHGSSSGENGWGVYGYASGSSGRGVYGYANGANAFAGYFAGNVYMDNLVGIGTNSPETHLTVQTGTQFNPGNYSDLNKGSVLLALIGGAQGLYNYGPGLSFSGINTTRRRAAIASIQTTSDPDQVGLAFFTHPSTAGPNEIVAQQMVITHGGNVGIGTASPETKLEVNGDLKVNGSYSGFPRPAYDSGWLYIATGESLTLTHGLGGDVENYVVDLGQSGNETHGINNRGMGSDLWSGGDHEIGARWSNLTTSQITVRRGATDASAVNVRVRIWVYN